MKLAWNDKRQKKPKGGNSHRSLYLVPYLLDLNSRRRVEGG
jgi:hypothetical protein